MRRSTIVWLATAGLVALSGGALVIPGALPAEAAPSSQVHRQNVLRLTSETTQFAVIDIGETGPALGLGDQLVSSDTVFRSGKAVGRAGTVVTVVGTTKNALTSQSTTTIDLPEGQIILQGIGDGPTGPPTVPLTVKVAVTGGTGAYSHALGEAEIIDNSGGKEELTIRLDN